MKEKLIKNLKSLLPDLEYARETHVQWRDCHQKWRDLNPDIGGKEFHSKTVEEYNKRINTIKETIQYLENN